MRWQGGILFERYYANSNWTAKHRIIDDGLLPSEHEVETDGALLMAPIGLSLSWPKSRDIGPGRLLEMAMRVEPLAFRVVRLVSRHAQQLERAAECLGGLCAG